MDSLVERFREWRQRNPVGFFAKTVDIEVLPTSGVPFTLTICCDAHAIDVLRDKSDPPCGVIRFRISAGYCIRCEEDEVAIAWGKQDVLPAPFNFEEFEVALNDLVFSEENDEQSEREYYARQDQYSEERGY
jgi:hypothetical protein